MKTVVLDANEMGEDLHAAIAAALDFPDYYGKNLDALHDCLTEICEETRIFLVNWDQTGFAGEDIKMVMTYSARENSALQLFGTYQLGKDDEDDVY